MNWNEYFIKMLPSIAAKSKDPNTKVGCIIVSDNNSILTTGYNDFPRKVCHNPDRYQRPLKYDYISHAEKNAVYNAARNGVRIDGATLYVSFIPCNECVNAIIGSGISKVIYDYNNCVKTLERFTVFEYDLKKTGSKAMPQEYGLAYVTLPVFTGIHSFHGFTENCPEWIQKLPIGVQKLEEAEIPLIPFGWSKK
jgi:dCMP deaminase